MSRVVVFTTRDILHSRVLEPSTPKCYLPGELFLGLLENTHTRGQAEDRKHVVYHRFCQTFKDCFPAETLSANTAEHHVKNVCVHSCVCEQYVHYVPSSSYINKHHPFVHRHICSLHICRKHHSLWAHSNAEGQDLVQTGYFLKQLIQIFSKTAG